MGRAGSPSPPLTLRRYESQPTNGRIGNPSLPSERLVGRVFQTRRWPDRHPYHVGRTDGLEIRPYLANGRIGNPSLPMKGIHQLGREESSVSTRGRRAPCYLDATCPPEAPPSSAILGRPPRPLVRDRLLPAALPPALDRRGYQSGGPGGLGAGPGYRPAGAAALHDHARPPPYHRPVEPCPGPGAGGRRPEALAGPTAGGGLAAGLLRPSAQIRRRIHR